MKRVNGITQFYKDYPEIAYFYVDGNTKKGWTGVVLARWESNGLDFIAVQILDRTIPKTDEYGNYYYVGCIVSPNSIEVISDDIFSKEDIPLECKKQGVDFPASISL